MQDVEVGWVSRKHALTPSWFQSVKLFCSSFCHYDPELYVTELEGFNSHAPVWRHHSHHAHHFRINSLHWRTSPLSVSVSECTPLTILSQCYNIRIARFTNIYSNFMHTLLTKGCSWQPKSLPGGLPDIATANVCKLDSKYCSAFIIYSSLLALEGRNIHTFEYISKPVHSSIPYHEYSLELCRGHTFT